MSKTGKALRKAEALHRRQQQRIPGLYPSVQKARSLCAYLRQRYLSPSISLPERYPSGFSSSQSRAPGFLFPSMHKKRAYRQVRSFRSR